MKKLLVHLLRLLYWLTISPIFILCLGFIILFFLLPIGFLCWLNDEDDYLEIEFDYIKSFVYCFILCMPSKCINLKGLKGL